MFVMFLPVLFCDVVAVCGSLGKLEKTDGTAVFLKVVFLMFLYSLLQKNAHYKGGF